MKRGLIFATAGALCAFAALCARAEWVYEGQWGRQGWGNGEFNEPSAVAVAPTGNVYVESSYAEVQYFTPVGSFLGKWGRIGSGETKVRIRYGASRAARCEILPGLG